MKEGNVLFNDSLNTFYLWSYDVRHMVSENSNNGKGNPLLPFHDQLFQSSNKGYFICTVLIFES